MCESQKYVSPVVHSNACNFPFWTWLEGVAVTAESNDRALCATF